MKKYLLFFSENRDHTGQFKTKKDNTQIKRIIYYVLAQTELFSFAKATQGNSMPLKATQCSSIQLNAIQCISKQLNATQSNSMQLSAT